MFKSYILKELKELIKQKSKKPNGFDYDVLTVSNTGGFIKQLDYFEDRVIASSDKKNYKKVIKNDFAYNPARINVGSIARLKNIEIGIVSPMYLVFSTSDELEPVFLEYFFQSNNFHNQMNKLLSGSVRKTLDFSSLEKIKIKVFNNEEQQKIGSFLSAIDELIVNQNRKMSSLSEYYKYLLNSIFINRLSFNKNQNFVENVLSKISIVKDGTHSSPTYVNDGYPLITSKNLMKNGKIEFKDLNYISKKDFDEINKRSKVDKGDILFGMIGTIGNPAICENDNFAIKNVALIKAKPPLNYFLIHYLKSKLVLDQFEFVKTGGTQKFIALNKIRALKIQLPKLEVQKSIGTFLNKIEELVNKEEKVLNIYSQIKKYYLSEIFAKGE
jgi:type I restriction enzyme S subunit